MKKRSLLLILMMALMVPWTAKAQKTIYIGNGTSYSSSSSSASGEGSPMGNMYYYNATSQFIYTADELSGVDKINSVAFYHNAASMKAQIRIYFIHTTASTVDESNPATTGTLVYEDEGGTVGSGSEEWQTFELSTPFDYNGTDNLLVVVCRSKNNSEWSSSLGWQYTETSDSKYMNRSSDNSGYDDITNTTYAYTAYNKRPNIKMVVTLASTGCDDLETLTIGETNPHDVTLSWTGGSGTYNVEMKGGAYTDWTNVASEITTTSFTKDNLTELTTYQVRVQSVCSGGLTSNWRTSSFTTFLCLTEDMCDITFELTDSYGDGWNGAYIDVVDVATSTSLAHMSNQNLAKGIETEYYTLAVCDGREIQFVWYSGNYDGECSYVVTDVNGEEIFSGSDAMSAPVNYTVECTVSTCKKPSNLAASEIGGHSAKLSWTENGEATAWVVFYALYGETDFTEVNVNNTTFTLTGLLPETHYTVKVKPECEVEKWSDVIDFTTDVACSAPNNLTVSDIKPNEATVSWTGEASEYNLRYRELTAEDFVTVTLRTDDVWQDGSGYQMLLDADATAYGTIIPTNGGLTSGGDASAATYAEFEYKIPTNADGAMNTTNMVCNTSVTIQIPAGIYDWCITNPTPGDRIWIAAANGNIPGRYDDYVFEIGKTYEFYVYYSGSGDAVDVTITDNSKGGRDIVWNEINGVTSPYKITAVDPDKNYVVEVQSDCDGEGTSAWTSAIFTTPSNCDVPTPLDVTELEAHSATLNWNGVQESFQVQYRTAASREEFYFEDFDNQPSTWTLTNTSWKSGSSSSSDYWAALGLSYTETAYLISPELTSYISDGSYVEFNQKYVSAAATFQVGFSSTTNDVDAFNWGSEVNAAETFFAPYSEEIPDGTKYIAIMTTTSTSECSVYINDFGIYGNVIPAGEWSTATVNNATTYAIGSGLIAETKYEWQVRGVNSSCAGGYTEWSELRTFTTPASCLVPTNLTVSNITASSAELAWVSSASAFDIYINGDIIENVTDNPYTLTNLTPETTNIVAVRANCGGGDYSNWTTAESFLTGCGGAKTLPYAYGFETNIDMTCWTASSANTANSMGIMNAADNGIDAYDGDYVFLFSSYSSASAYDQYLISPELDGGADPVGAEFYYRSLNGSGSGEKFVVGYSTTTDDFAAFTWGEEISTTSIDWTPFNAIFPAGTKYVAIHYYADYQYYMVVDAFSFTTPAEIIWNAANSWPTNTIPPEGNDVTIPEYSIVIIPNGYIANAGNITLPASSSIIIQDGGQLIHHNTVEATLQKDIEAYTSKDGDGWYLIASPVDGHSTDAVAQGTYDLFVYNEPNAYWYSNTGNHPFNTLSRSKGYLYANANDIDIEFTGEMIGTESNIFVDLSYGCNAYPDLKGYNLLGNPFSRNLVNGDMKIGGTAVTSVLLLNNDEDYQVCNFLESGTIKPGQGFFIQATAENQKLVFNPSSKDENAIGFISIKAGDENYIDKAYIQIGDGNTLRKMTFSGNTMVYVMNEGDDYAVTTIDELAGAMPVNFKAAEDGEYTITVNAKNIEASTMILFDDFTGEEINLLESPTYHFKAEANDPENRFKLIFDLNNNYTGLDENYTGDSFVYQNGDEIIVNGEGELKVYDVLGRLVSQKHVNGVETYGRTSLPSGVYILKLNENTQKIIIK